MIQEAAEALEKATQITPDNGEAFFLLGKALEGQNEKEKASEAFRMAQGQMAENYEVLIRVGADLLEKEQYAEALTELTKACEYKEANHEVYFLLGKTHRGLGNNEEAVKAFEKADELMEDMEDDD
jgi:tetratricopeptide (TPR) repeat protein